METEKIIWILATGAAGAYIAKKRKLNPFFWFGVCCMLGLTALLGFIFLPFFLKKWKKKTPIAPKPEPIPFSLETIWYYLDEEEKQNGPMSLLKLQEIKQQGIIKESSYIWNETFNHWKPWREIFPSPQQ